MGRPKETIVRQLMVVKLAILAAAVAASQPSADCEKQCGELQIPYPFGLREGCYLDETFLITCNKIDYNPPQAFLGQGNVVVTNISINGELHIMPYIARDCYAPNGDRLIYVESSLWMPEQFSISNAKNKFTVIGCDTYAYMLGTVDGEPYKIGCIAFCNSSAAVRNGSCYGSGCCQLEIPEGLRNLELEVYSFENHTSVKSFNPCGYAFVIERDKFNFSSTYLQNYTDQKAPMVLDWTVNGTTCEKAANKTQCVCGPNSEKIDMSNSEYRCNCSQGYEGNPYLGCQDINECSDKKLNDCKYECVNTIGNYTCKCPTNYNGDGRRGGEGCTRNFKSFVYIIVGIGVGFIVLLIGSSWLYFGYKKWKFIQQKDKFFQKNGGSILQQQQINTVTIFTQEELENATNKYDESAVVGKGGYGTVYKGVLDSGLVVAIKKSKLVDQSQTSQFINEVIVLSQINHRNVVKLLGCCLETEVPLLVYEFITNGTLYDHIHDKTNHASLSWEARLKIASETAGVLSYLHSSASNSIIHRDIKSTNILLDGNYTAKVSDFGASKLVPMDQTQLSTMVQGTLGYLDPEYLLTSELTEKSDVYSFGIVLLELISGKKAVRFDGPEVERNLAMYVLCAMKEDRVEEVVEKGMATERNFDQIKEVAKLAKECLKVRGEERPSMREVAMELEGLRRVQVEHSWVNKNLSNAEEMTYLLDGASDSSSFVVSGNMNAMDHSIKAQILSHIPSGR